jgi:hypothetical protein
MPRSVNTVDSRARYRHRRVTDARGVGGGELSATQYKVGFFLLLGAAGVIVLFHFTDLRLTTAAGTSSAPDFPSGGPAEFLYLDSGRVDAYLGQIDGGSFDTEKVTHKLSDTLSGKLTLAGAAEAGESHAQESLSEREVKPTEASRFFSLYQGLEKEGDLRSVGLRESGADIKPLPEGQFVKFRTGAMKAPIYLNPYMASRQQVTLASIFPGGDGAGAMSAVERALSKRFFTELGKEPRVVFSLQPENGNGATFLLPIQAQLLSSERSLLKYGGGEFTVVGKLVRRFPEGGDHHEPAYIDTATLETWERPLQRAPGELVCRTDPRCASVVRAGHLSGRERLTQIEASRRRALNALDRQTEISGDGAVILPIAIYK